MGVVNVTTKWTGRSDEYAHDGGYTHTSAYTVLLDGNDDPEIAPWVARNAPDIPRVGDPLSYDPFIRCKRTGARPVGGSMVLWDVNCYYHLQTTGTDDTGEGMSNPLEQTPKVSWSTAANAEAIDEDIHGDPIVNVNEEPFDPPVQRDYSDVILQFEANQLTFNYGTAVGWRDAVNTDVFLGYAAGVARLMDWSAEHIYDGAFDYWRVKIKVQFRERGWKKRILNQGLRVWTGNHNDDGSREYENVTDKDGNPVQEPVLLDADGYRLPDAAMATWVEFDVYPQKAFATLGIHTFV